VWVDGRQEKLKPEKGLRGCAAFLFSDLPLDGPTFPHVTSVVAANILIELQSL